MDILEVLKNNNITLHLVSKGDEFCEANGEQVYINQSYSAINDIWLGIYDSPEIKNISLCHEIAHCLIEDKIEFDNLYQLEKYAWEKTFDIVKECDLTLSESVIKWSDDQLKTYEKYENN